MPLWLSSGDSTPARSAFITSPVNACSDDAEPRWRGYMSSTASVRIGNTSAMPNEPIDLGRTAQGIDGTGTRRLKATLAPAPTAQQAEPIFARRQPTILPALPTGSGY